MLLYATTTSERASKGQGGNEYIDIDIKDEKKNIIAIVHVRPSKHKGKPVVFFKHDIGRTYLTTSLAEFQAIQSIEKGNNQKGEMFLDCTHTRQSKCNACGKCIYCNCEGHE